MYNIVNTDIICPECGEGHMIRQDFYRPLMSNTEKYVYLCPDCGFVHAVRSNEDMNEWIKSLDKPIEEEILKEKGETKMTFEDIKNMLKPCPFCGTKNFSMNVCMSAPDNAEQLNIHCSCGVSFDIWSDPPRIGFYSPQYPTENAFDKWNRRGADDDK